MAASSAYELTNCLYNGVVVVIAWDKKKIFETTSKRPIWG